MKKSIKIILIIIGILLGIILLDSLQAKIFNSTPLIKVRCNIDGGILDYIDKGILVYHYAYTNNENKTVFRWEKYSPYREVKSQTELESEQEKEIKENTRMIMVNGKLYYDTCEMSKIKLRCGTLDGTITSVVDSSEIPTKDNQANFTGSRGYQGVGSTLEIPMDDGWHVFKLVENND